jgi:hypothetical protein
VLRLVSGGQVSLPVSQSQSSQMVSQSPQTGVGSGFGSAALCRQAGPVDYATSCGMSQLYNLDLFRTAHHSQQPCCCSTVSNSAHTTLMSAQAGILMLAWQSVNVRPGGGLIWKPVKCTCASDQQGKQTIWFRKASAVAVWSWPLCFAPHVNASAYASIELLFHCWKAVSAMCCGHCSACQ